MAKLVMFLCLALAIACAPSANAGIWDGITGRAEAIRKEVTERINGAIEKIEEIVEETKEMLTKLFNRIQEMGDKIMEDIANQTSEIVNNVNEAIAEARERGIDIAECAEKQATLQKTVKEATDAVTTCVNEQVSDTYNDINDVFEAASRNIQELRQILEKLTNCGSSITCYIECSAEAGIKSVSAVAEVASKAYNIKTSLEQRIVTLPLTCGLETLPRIHETLVSNGKEAIECIQSKME